MIKVFARFWMDAGVVLVPLFAAVMWFAWYKSREVYRRGLYVATFGIFCSKHQTVNAESTPDYFDADLFLSTPKDIGVVMSWFKDELDNQQRDYGEIDRLAFVERHDEGPVGAITLKDLLSWEVQLPTVILRPARKGPALRMKCVETETTTAGSKLYRCKTAFKTVTGTQEHIVLVSDVATTGTTILDAVQVIEEFGGIVDASFVLYDRMEGAEAALQARGIRLVAMLKADKLVDLIHKQRNSPNDVNNTEVTKCV